MSDTSLQPGPRREQVPPGREVQLSCPQPLAGSPAKAKGTLQTSSPLPGIAASRGCPGAGLRQPLPGPLPSRSPPASRTFGTGSPGSRPLAPGDGQVVGAAVTLLQADFLSPGVGNPRSGAGPWNVTSDFRGGASRWSPRLKTVCLRASRSPLDARKMHVPVLKPPALKTPLTTQPIKLAFLRQLAHN